MRFSLKHVISQAVFLWVVTCLSSYGAASETTFDRPGLLVKDGKMSADLRNVPLRDVLRQIEEQEGIWFRTGANLSGERASLQLKDIPLEAGIRRILAGMSYSFVYNAQGRVVGVFILGKGGEGRERSVPGRVPVVTRTENPVATEPEQSENAEATEPVTPKPADPAVIPKAPPDAQPPAPGTPSSPENRPSKP